MSEPFDIGPLTWVHDEIKLALHQVVSQLDTFEANPENTSALRHALTHLNQVNGALDMVGLEGCKRFCFELETLISVVEKQVLLVSPEMLMMLKHGLFELEQYLQDLLNGEPDQALKLYGSLQKLADFRGEALEPSVLFFPELNQSAPKEIQSQPLLVAEDPLVFFNAQRNLFQRSLVQWLKAPAESHLQGIAQALAQVQASQEKASQRVFWWVASAFAEALSQSHIAEHPHVKKTLRRIDQQLRALESGNGRANQALLKDMLYFTAIADEGAEKIAQVKALFALDCFIPKSTSGHHLLNTIETSDSLQTSQLIEPMLVELERLKSIWTEVSVDKVGSFASFVANTQNLLDFADGLRQPAITKLLVAFNVFAQVWDEGGLKPTDDALVEVAAGLALLDDALRHYPQFNHDAMTHLRTQAQRIQNISQVVMGDEASTTGTQHGLADDVLKALAIQIKDALYLCEQTLDGFFRNPEKKEHLRALNDPFKQLLAAFDMLNTPIPMEVISVSKQLISQFSLHPVQSAHFEYLANTLSLLSLFVEDLPRINPSRLLSLEDSLSTLKMIVDGQLHSNEANLATISDDLALDATDLSVEDAEMLEVFLQEAGEVLAMIAVNIQSLKADPSVNDDLIELRRGFHTIKGGGRMVGLPSLGELAWLVEALLNQVIEYNLVLEAELIYFAERVVQLIANALPIIRTQKTFSLDLSPWQQDAEKLKAGLGHSAQENTTEQLLIGGKQKISRALFDIFIEEAHQHLDILKTAQLALDNEARLSSLVDVRRASHTLASNSGAAGFLAIEALSRGFEHWLDVERIHWSAQDIKLFAKCLSTLEAMLKKANTLTQPKQVPKLLKEIRDAIALANQTASSVDITSLPNGQLHEHERVDNDLLDMFAEEANDLHRQSGACLRAWQNEPEVRAHAENLQRALHTLKGSARMVGQMLLGEAVHHLEDALIKALSATPDSIDFDDLFTHLDFIAGQLENKQRNVAQAQAELAFIETDAEPNDEAAFLRPVFEAGSQQLRLRADVLDRLINDAGEISIARSRMEREMQGFKQYSHDLTDTLLRLKAQLREMEIEAESTLQSRMAHLQEVHESFDPLEFDRFTRLQELTRLMAETVNDVATVQQSLVQNLDETESALSQQNRMNRELQYALIDIRMVPFSSISERLHRIVRQTARELDKRAQLIIDGEHVDVDRSMLEHIAGALEHLLRNAVAHGLEALNARAKAQKDLLGKITIKVRRENDEIVIVVMDDGAGINLDKLRSKAMEQGRLSQGQYVTEQNLLAMMFERGFSTASAVTQISGRGVGLDSVRSDVSTLGGRIDVANNEGAGASFSIYLPVTLSVAQVVMVRVGSLRFALPAVMVEQVQKVKSTSLADVIKDGAFVWNERDYPLHYLGHLVGAHQFIESQPYTLLVLLRSGQHLLALQVDEVIGNQELVMKPIGPQLARMAGIVGVSVMGDGQIIYMLNPLQITHHEVLVAGGVNVSHVQAIDNRRLVLVVDDSLTMRKVLSRLLERAQYRVMTAINGIDALQVLQDITPDIILTDIEMPHMDGFELVRHLRNDALTANTPIVIISSRTAEKHQALANSLGVNGFMGKPIHDDALLTHISSLLE